MEKLIIEHATFNSPKKMCTINGCGEVTNRSSCGKMCREIEGTCSKCPIMEVFERLAEYEATDITPEQIREIDKLYRDRLKEIEELKRAAGLRWIPCSERLPGKDGKYLVTYCDDLIKNYVIERNFYNGKFEPMPYFEEYTGRKALAWQPLPEPYRTEECEE